MLSLLLHLKGFVMDKYTSMKLPVIKILLSYIVLFASQKQYVVK